MEYTRLGSSGLEVSRITVGCMSWGDGGIGRPRGRSDESFAEQTVRAALDAGVNFFDTANVYSGGTSEEYTGRSLWKHVDREDVVLATKVFMPMRPGPNGRGLSRKAILQEIDASLSRLGTDYVDLYQIHRWDPMHPGRGDHGGAARRREGGQGALSRGVVDVCLAVRQGAARGAQPRLDAVRVHAEPLQPDLPRGGAGDASALPGPGRRGHPVEPAGPRPPHAGLGHPDGALGHR